MNDNNNNYQRNDQNIDQRRGGSRGNGRRPWGSRNRGGGRPPVNVAGPRPTYDGSNGIPQGQHLSKVSSPLSNDPLSEKAYFPGPSEEFRAIASREKIYPTCTFLPEIMEQSFTKIVSVSPSFGKTVPRSAYDYYISIVVAYRLLLLHQKSGGVMTIGEMNFISQMENANYAVPKSVSLYLSGMGSTNAPKSRELEFAYDKPELAGGNINFGENGEIHIPGFFGPIIANLGLYASYPSTGVFASAVAMDLLRTRFRDRPQAWDLPEPFLYPNHPINHNCLGYQFARTLTREGERFFEDAGVTIETFDFENQEIALNNNIMTAVHTKLTDTRVTLFQVSSLRIGSVGQIAIEKVSQQTTRRAISAQWEAHTAFEMPSAEGYLGASFGYLIDKSPTILATLKSLLPVTFAVNAHVPPEQIASLNHAYTRTADFIKPRLFAVIPFSPAQRIERIIQHDNTG